MNVLFNKFYKLLLVGIIAILFSGCSSMQAMSKYARTGDTVSIALGGTEESNALVEVLKKEDIVVIVTDFNGIEHPVTLKKLFRVYPDHTSEYVYNTSKNSNQAMSAYTPPLIGQWIAVVDLVDPQSGLAPLLAIGDASISVSSIGQISQDVRYTQPGFQFPWENGDLGSVYLEILPGQGTPNSLNYVGPMSYDPVATLEPLPQIIVSPSSVPVAEFAGGSFLFVYNANDFATVIKAVPANHDPNVQLVSKTSDLGNGNKELKVTLLNPKGFSITNRNINNNKINLGGSSPFRSARFALIWNNTASGAVTTITDTNWQNSIQISGNYIDMQGDPVTGIVPVMKKVR